MSIATETINAGETRFVLLENELIRLISTSPAVRYQLIGATIGTFAERTDLQAILKRIDAQGERTDALREDFNRQFAAHSKRMDHFAEVQAEHSKRMDMLRDDFNRSFNLLAARFEETTGQLSDRVGQLEETTERLEETTGQLSDRVGQLEETTGQLSDRVGQLEETTGQLSDQVGKLEETTRRLEKVTNKVHSHLGAMGARWGMQSESAFRTGLADILAQETDLRVVNYLRMDTQGLVFGRPDQVEIDVVVQNGAHTLLEIKSSVGRSDVYLFVRKVEFYKQEEGVSVKRMLIIAPMLGRGAQELADELGVEVFTSVYDVNG